MTDKDVTKFLDGLDGRNDALLRTWFDRMMVHAREHWNEDGWDIFYEAWSFEDFVDHVEHAAEPCLTYEDAFTDVSSMLKIIADVREDVRGA